MPWRWDFTAGLLTLKSPDATDMCYSSYVMVEQSTLLPTDLGYRFFEAGFIPWSFIGTGTIPQSASKEPDILDIAAPSVLSGVYTDNWGITMARNLSYRVSIHLWVTINDLYNVPCHE
ncbi:hypothetical protein [Chitinophaga agri]|uniref:Uncharacterized protein n=1 Tax=Chitinophaga agri TaxID=2703787 RepID=A0A6B9ZEM9_9BACT|nr:hypothetical protein [Chitinophaga agri]QHS60828.1 hypothetical protein GWR21_14855 [Chitinophaga agri]